MTLLVSHPTGIANVRALLRTAERMEVLDSFWTALALPPSLGASEWLGPGLKRRLASRVFKEAPWRRTRTCPARELARLLAVRLGLQQLVRHEAGWASVERIYRDVDCAVARYLRHPVSELRAVYAYEDGALDTFRAARTLGIARIYHLPIPYWRTQHRLLQEEAELHPAWATTMAGLLDSDAKLAAKDEEISLASRIVVASGFTRRSLEVDFIGPLAPITTASYGAPAPRIARPASRSRGEPIHVFYAGQLTQRKGLCYLIAALRRLDVPWRLTVAGSRPTEAPRELDDFLADERCRYLGQLPQVTLMERMAEAHVFAFPSICEGFGMVLWEAMACGLPVITTPHTAGPEIIGQGVEGVIVPIRDPDAIAEAIADLYADEDQRLAMATAALRLASSSSWSKYEASLASMLEEILA